MSQSEEAILLEHVDSVVKLLNSLAQKHNVKSQHVVRRLDYLYDRLRDFLDRDWPSSLKVAGGGVRFECGVCKHPITIYSSEHMVLYECGVCKVFMSGEEQPSKEDKFWAKIPEVWRAHRLHFSSQGDGMLHCNACKVNVPKAFTNMLGHIRGKKHLRMALPTS